MNRNLIFSVSLSAALLLALLTLLTPQVNAQPQSTAAKRRV